MTSSYTKQKTERLNYAQILLRTLFGRTKKKLRKFLVLLHKILRSISSEYLQRVNYRSAQLVKNPYKFKQSETTERRVKS